MSKKKILFISPSLCYGGLENYLITVLSLLDEKKYEMYLYTYYEDNSLLPLVPEYVKVTNDLLDKHYQRNPRAFWLLLSEKLLDKLGAKNKAKKCSVRRKLFVHQKKVNQINKAYKHQKFDIVIANSIGLSLEMAATVKATKRFAFFHSSVDLHHETNDLIFPKYNGIIAVSQGVKDMLCSSYDNIDNKVYILENYVDAEQIIAKANEPISEDIDTNRKIICCTCGRFSQEKGFDLAVESAHILKDKGVDFLWLFVGDGVLRENLKQTISKYDLTNGILITGYKENPFPYIKLCNVYVQPSYHESYGRTIKEAIILEKPVVSTDTVGGHTVLEEGKYGEIVPLNPDDIAKGIIIAKDKEYLKYDIKSNKKEKETFVKGLEEILGI